MNKGFSNPFLLFFPLSSLLTASVCPAVNLDYSAENTNIGTYQQESRFSDFNRLRFNAHLNDERIPGLDTVVIIDNTTIFSQEEYQDFKNSFTLYRGYVEFGTESHLLTVGRQRIPFGVGRIWNPIDTFNPIDSTSIEPQERKGVDAVRYEYAISDLSNFDMTLAEKKGAARIKGFLSFADLALLAVLDNDDNHAIVGWEMEGELFETGIDVRSEGGIFYDQDSRESHCDLIIGAEYGFSNSLTLLLEYYYKDNPDDDYFGLSANYQLSPLTVVNLLMIFNVESQSILLAPSLTYSLGDETTLAGGFFLHDGNTDEDADNMEDMIFLKWFLHF